MNFFIFLVVFARLPFVVSAFHNGIPSINLTYWSVSTTIQNVLGFDVQTISTQLKINIKLSTLMSLSKVTFKQLSIQLSHKFGSAVSYKQLYHISVLSLLDAVLARNNTKDMITAVDAAIRYVSLQMKLRDVRIMYQISHQHLMNSSLVTLLTEQSDVKGSEVATALNMSLVQERLLAKVRVVDAQILLGLKNEIFDLTTERMGHRIINLHAETIVLFRPIEELMAARNLSLANLQGLKLPFLLSSISSGSIDQIFKRMNISKMSQIFFFGRSMGEISSALRISTLSALAKWHIFRIFWDFKIVILMGELIITFSYPELYIVYSPFTFVF